MSSQQSSQQSVTRKLARAVIEVQFRKAPSTPHDECIFCGNSRAWTDLKPVVHERTCIVRIAAQVLKRRRK